MSIWDAMKGASNEWLRQSDKEDEEAARLADEERRFEKQMLLEKIREETQMTLKMDERDYAESKKVVYDGIDEGTGEKVIKYADGTETRTKLPTSVVERIKRDDERETRKFESGLARDKASTYSSNASAARSAESTAESKERRDFFKKNGYYPGAANSSESMTQYQIETLKADKIKDAVARIDSETGKAEILAKLGTALAGITDIGNIDTQIAFILSQYTSGTTAARTDVGVRQ